MSGTPLEYHGGRGRKKKEKERKKKGKKQGINLNTGFAVSLRRVVSKRTNRFSLFPLLAFLFFSLLIDGGYKERAAISFIELRPDCT